MTTHLLLLIARSVFEYFNPNFPSRLQVSDSGIWVVYFFEFPTESETMLCSVAWIEKNQSLHLLKGLICIC